MPILHINLFCLSLYVHKPTIPSIKPIQPPRIPNIKDSIPHTLDSCMVVLLFVFCAAPQ